MPKDKDLVFLYHSHEPETLARKFGLPVETVRDVCEKVGRSAKKVEAELLILKAKQEEQTDPAPGGEVL